MLAARGERLRVLRWTRCVSGEREATHGTVRCVREDATTGAEWRYNMSMPGHPACPRCYCEEEVVRPWRGFRAVRGIWLCGAGLILLFSPILFSDLLVMIPLTTIFLLAGGPALACAAQAPTCVRCGLERPQPGWHETPCRPVRLVDGAPRSALRESPRATSDTDEVSGLHDLPGPGNDRSGR